MTRYGKAPAEKNNGQINLAIDQAVVALEAAGKK